MNTDLDRNYRDLEPGEPPGAASYVTGALGALLGALVGSIPLLLVGAVTGIFSGLLGFLTGFGAVKGYILFKGARKNSYAMTMVVGFSLLAIFISCALCTLIYFAGDEGVKRTAARWGLPVMQVAWSVMTENLPLVALSFAVPIVVSAVGIFLARRQLVNYTQPELLRQAVDAAEQTLSKDGSGTQLYFPDSASFKSVRITNLGFMVPFMLLIVGFLVLMLNPETSEIIEDSIPFMIALLVTICLILAVFFGVLIYSAPILGMMEYCYARDGQGKLWRIRLTRLNAIPSYQFGAFSGLTAINIKKMTQEQQALAQAAVLRAIQDIREGHAYPGSPLTDIVVPMEDLEIQKETHWAWRCRYTAARNKRKKVIIAKAYLGMHPLDNREAVPAPKVQKSMLLVGIIAAVALAVVFLLAFLRLQSQQQDTDLSLHTYAPFSMDGITVDVDDAWLPDADGVFRSEDGKQSYRIVVTFLGSRTPDKAYQEMRQMYSDRYTTISTEAISTSTSVKSTTAKDGVAYQYATIAMFEDADPDSYVCIATMLAPDKNLWVSLQGYGSDREVPVIATQLQHMRDSLTSEELESVLSTHMNGYAPGASTPYDILTGLDPDQYPDTKDYYQVCRDTFYAVILHNDTVFMGPGDVRSVGTDTLYLGYYIPELDKMDMTNANLGNHHSWAYMDRTSELDVEPQGGGVAYTSHDLDPAHTNPLIITDL